MSAVLHMAVVQHNTGETSVFLHPDEQEVDREIAECIRGGWWSVEFRERPLPDLPDDQLVRTYFELCAEEEREEYLEYDQMDVQGVVLEEPEVIQVTNKR